MLHALLPHDFNECEPENAEIHRGGLPFKVLAVELHFDRNTEFISTVDLGPTSETRTDLVDAGSGAQFDKIVLIEQRGPRADKAELAAQDTPKLREFVQAGLSQEMSKRSDMAGHTGQQMGRNLRRAHAHAAELRHAKDVIALTDTIGPVQCRTRGCEADQDHKEKEHGRKDDQQKSREDQVETTLAGAHRWPR